MKACKVAMHAVMVRYKYFEVLCLYENIIRPLGSEGL